MGGLLHLKGCYLVKACYRGLVLFLRMAITNKQKHKLANSIKYVLCHIEVLFDTLM